MHSCGYMHTVFIYELEFHRDANAESVRARYLRREVHYARATLQVHQRAHIVLGLLGYMVMLSAGTAARW